MDAWYGILGLVVVLVAAGSGKRVLPRRRRSIHGMLDDSRPCATRSRS
jgi:hypothetical protein